MRGPSVWSSIFCSVTATIPFDSTCQRSCVLETLICVLETLMCVTNSCM